MTVKEEIHRLVEKLPENQAELARQMLQDLCDAADANGPPLAPEVLASLDRGLADIAAGRVKTLEQYKRERQS
jgi:predicted transcriptional regulator